MILLLRAGVSTSNGARRNLWRGLASHLQRRTLATVEASVASQSKPEEFQTNSDDASKKAETAVPPTAPTARIAANTMTSSEADCSKPSFGPFPPYSHPNIPGLPDDSWRRALLNYVEDPQYFGNVTFWRNEHVMVVYDHLPKAKMHLLALTRRCYVNNLSELTREHIPHLKELAAVAESIICSLSEVKEIADVGFQYGFHAVANMMQLPLHIVSRDFISEKMTKKRHWNAFNTDFFIPAQTVITALERDGKLTLLSDREYLKMLKLPMHCQRCNKLLGHMPKVWRHVLKCEAEAQGREFEDWKLFGAV